MIHLDHRLKFDETLHHYFLDDVQLPSVTSVLAAAGLVDYSFISAEDRARYLDRGRRVHAATHDDDLGRLRESAVDSEIRGYLLAWRKFRSDYAFVPILIEHRLFHAEYQYAGTLNRVGRIRDGTELIADLKTGTAPTAVRYQLAAYNACLPHPRTRRRRCVELHQDGAYKVIPFETSDYLRDLNEFLAALEVFRAKEKGK